MSKPPISPYPPDPDPDAAPPASPDELLDVTVEDADWANARVARFSARRAELHRVRLTGAQLAEGAVTDVTFADCRLDLTSFRFAKLERVVFRDCVLGELDLYGAKLVDVLFERCDLRAAAFDGATLERVEVRGCQLDGLSGVEALRGARMPWHDIVENGPLFASALGIETADA